MPLGTNLDSRGRRLRGDCCRDLLYHDRRDLTSRPLRGRRARLEDVVAGSELVFPVRRLAADGLEAWKQVVERRSRRTVGSGGSAWCCRLVDRRRAGPSRAPAPCCTLRR